MDLYIEQKEKMTVSQIFEAYGEEGFRAREAQVVQELAEKENMVIACGGGTVLAPGNVALFHQGGDTIFFLDVPLAALQERLKSDTRRPLLQKPNRRQVIEELYQKRRPLYENAADVRVDAGAPPGVVARRVIEMVK